MATPFFPNPDRLVLGMRTVPMSYTAGDVPWGIAHTDRRNHLYCIGKTGMGKTALLRNILLQDIMRGAGIGLIDPHGDLAESLLDAIPSERTNDVVYFNPSDLEYPIAWNLVAAIPPDARALTADFLVDAFKSIFGDSWGPRLQFILYHALRACLDAQQTTLVSVYRMLTDERYRSHILSQTLDPVCRDFWHTEFAAWPERYRLEAVSSIRNKLGRFLGSPAVRNIVGQFQGKLDLDFVINNNRRIFIANLAKGMLGPDQANLLGSLLVAQFQAAAFKRATIPEEERQDFYLVIDEFQNFMTDSFASILSEARKYHLCLTLAHQYLGQARPAVREAVFGNVGSIIAFRVGGPDGEALERVFRPDMLGVHFLGLEKYEVIAGIQEGTSRPVPFRGTTLAPLRAETGRKDAIIALSRERYARPRAVVEPRIAQGFPLGSESERNRKLG
jgi:hypothetical protein